MSLAYEENVSGFKQSILGHVYTESDSSDQFGIGSTIVRIFLFTLDRFETGTVPFHTGSPS